MQHSHASAFLISDLHLTPSMPLTAQRFFDFCEKEAREVEAVFILGDLFEYWVGDDANAPRFVRTVAGRGYCFIAEVVVEATGDAISLDDFVQRIAEVFFQVSEDQPGFLVHDPGVIDIDELGRMRFDRLIFSDTANDAVHHVPAVVMAQLIEMKLPVQDLVR